MNESKSNLMHFLIMLSVVLITIIISSIIFLFGEMWFLIIGITMVVSDLISIIPIANMIPIVGQILFSIFQGISNIRVGYKTNVYIGFGITLFLHFGLDINLVKLLFGLF